jgi:hypothetical protein
VQLFSYKNPMKGDAFDPIPLQPSHTYRSWLDGTGAPMTAQQELMRHASIETTMNVCGQAMSSSKLEANGKVVEMVLKPAAASALKTATFLIGRERESGGNCDFP